MKITTHFFLLFILVINSSDSVFSQKNNDNLSGLYHEVNALNKKTSNTFLQVEKYRKNYYYFSIKNIDTSVGYEVDMNELNISGIIKFDTSLNCFLVVSSDDSRVDSLLIDSVNMNLKLTLFRKKNNKNNTSGLFDIGNKIIGKSALDTLTLFFKRTENIRIPLFKHDNNNLKIFNYYGTSNRYSKFAFYSFPDSLSSAHQIKFSKNEHIVIVNSVYLKGYLKKIAYYLAYIKPFNRITEGKYDEYELHFWIKLYDLYSNFKYQK